nr:hypothetical protein [Tanacetum cinerariifolium]
MAFVSSSNNSSTNGAVNTAQAVYTANEVSTASTQVNAAFSSNIDNLSNAKVLEEIGRKLTINGNETIGFEKSYVKCYNCHKKRHFARECRAPINQDSKHKESTRRSVPVETHASRDLVSCDDNCKKGLGYENYNAVPPSYTGTFMPLKPDLSFIGLDEFVNKPKVVEDCKVKPSKETSKDVRKNTDAPIIEDKVSDNKEDEVTQPKVMMKIVKPGVAKIEFVKPRQQKKISRKIAKLVEHHRQNIHRPRGNQRN